MSLGLPPCHKVSISDQKSSPYFFIPLLYFSLSLWDPKPGRSESFKVKPPPFSHSLPSLLHAPFLLLHLHLLVPPSTSSFHSTAPCVLSTAGQASSERQDEQSAPVMTACPSEYTFLSSPQLSGLPDPPSLSHCDPTPALFAILFLFCLVLPSCRCQLLFLPCNPALALPSITGSSCPLLLPCICLNP